MTSFGEYIRDNRIRKNWTQTEFGAQLGINSSAISKIENGSKALSKKKLNLLSQIFKVPIQEVKELYYADKFTNELIANNCTTKVIERMKVSMETKNKLHER